MVLLVVYCLVLQNALVTHIQCFPNGCFVFIFSDLVLYKYAGLFRWKMVLVEHIC